MTNSENREKNIEKYQEEFKDLIEIREGDISIKSFPPSDYQDRGKALTKSMPVFYNPIQEVNRSLSIIVYKVFLEKYSKYLRDLNETQKNKIGHTEKEKQEKSNKKEEKKNNNNKKKIKLSIVDSMAATGVRSIRLFKYLKDNIGKIIQKHGNINLKIIANDLNPMAKTLIQKNISLNQLNYTSLGQLQMNEKLFNIELSTNEITYYLHRLSYHRDYATIIDIDPFGTPNRFIKDALEAIDIQGMLAVTATDTAVLFGVRKIACRRKYNVKPMKPQFLKEVGLRILLYFIASRAHITKKAIKPFLSLSTDHYIRVFVQIRKGHKHVIYDMENIGYMLWCPECYWRGTHEFDLTGIKWDCPLCGNKIEYGGPLWIGSLQNKKFLEDCKHELKSAKEEQIPSKESLIATIETMMGEAGLPAGYYNIHRICKKLTIPVAKMDTILERIEQKGFKASRSHIEPVAIKTDMGIEDLKDVLEDLQT